MLSSNCRGQLPPGRRDVWAAAVELVRFPDERGHKVSGVANSDLALARARKHRSPWPGAPGVAGPCEEAVPVSDEAMLAPCLVQGLLDVLRRGSVDPVLGAQEPGCLQHK
eukprot:15475546-Alexandrium_andersonii.AAC.1